MSSCSFTQARCHVDLSALKRNFARCGRPEDLMPVLKSDAYGHGLVQCARALGEAGAQRFAVGCPDEGRHLRENGLSQRIMPLMPPTSADEWDMVHAKDLTPLLCTMDQVEAAAARSTSDHPMRVALKVETGMHRQGFREEEFPALVARLKRAPALEPVLLVSHCASADMPEKASLTAEQIGVFSRYAATLGEAFPKMKSSIFNSAGIIDTESRCNLVDISRPGIILYGGNPFANTSREHLGDQFEWTMSLSTTILQVTELRAGESVSYGGLFVADRSMKLAVAGSGYANAVPRCLTWRLDALVHGKRVRSVGRVCMNMIMFDVTDIPDVKAGDELWLLGGEAAPGNAPVTPREWADNLGTISYEILCLVGGMNPRDYTG